MCKITQIWNILNFRYQHLNRSSILSFINLTIVMVFFMIGVFTPVNTVKADSSFLIGGFQTATGQDAGIFTESPTRQKIDLSGLWQVSVNGGAYESIEVPSAYDDVGQFHYERTFTIPSEVLDDASFELVAYGINYTADITINGTSVGSQSGGYTSFTIPVSADILREGENIIQISVNNYLRPRDTLPIKPQMWTPRNYGGIFRDIYILRKPATSIIDKQIHTTFLDGYTVAEMDVDVSLQRQNYTSVDPDPDIDEEEFVEDTYQVAVTIIDRMRGITLAQSQRVSVEFENARTVHETIRVIARNPRLWSPGQPDLYTVSIIVYRNGVEYDIKNVIYGFRDIEIRDGAIYLNGEPFRARGIVYHEYHPDSGNAMSYEKLERDVALMSIANINFVRVAFHPPHPYLLNLFDRYGILCMIEMPAVNIPGSLLKNPVFRETAKFYLESMIKRDRHHPSIFAWGIGDNLEMPHQGTQQYVQDIREFVQSMDERPVYAASQFPANDMTTEYLDLAVMNFPPGLRKGVPESVREWKERYPDKPLLIGKLGYYVEPGNTRGYNDPASYNAQARYLLQMMQTLREHNIDGVLINSFTDWRAERPIMVVPDSDFFLHTSGILSADRQQRKGFEVVRALYRGDPPPTLTAGELPSRTPFEYIVGGFLVLIGFAYMLNSSRRFRENVNRSLLRPYNFYADVRDQRVLSGFHTINLGLLISLTMGMIFASFIQHYSQNQLVDHFFTHFLITDSAKTLLANSVNNTWQIILIIAALYLLMMVLISLVVKLCSFFIKTRVLLSHSFVITFWSALPLVAFIPLAMILYNVLETEFYVAPAFILIGLLMLWVLFRLLKGISIIYDVIPFRVYILGIFILISFNVIMLLISEYLQATFSYISFFIHMFEGFRF